MVILVVEAVPQHKTHIMKRYYLHFLPCITHIHIIYIASRFSTYKMHTHFMFFCQPANVYEQMATETG